MNANHKKLIFSTVAIFGLTFAIEWLSGYDIGRNAATANALIVSSILWLMLAPFEAVFFNDSNSR